MGKFEKRVHVTGGVDGESATTRPAAVVDIGARVRDMW